MQNKVITHEDIRNLLLTMMYECEDLAGLIQDVEADRVRATSDWNYTRQYDPNKVRLLCYDRARALRDNGNKLMIFYETKKREEVI